VCIHIPAADRPCTLHVVLPEEVRRSQTVEFRFDPAPSAVEGVVRVSEIRFVQGDDDDHDEDASRVARLEDLKDRVRRACEAGEIEHVPVMEHLPQSLKLELTARCNLTCPHCSSHGTEELHLRHNRMPEMPVEQLVRLADEVFPSLTSLGLVGRGEPLLVSNRLWSTLIDKLDEYRVLLTLVTNGTLVHRRITPDVMRLVETLHVSVDGGTESTFAINRKGAHLAQAVDALEYLNEVRRPLGRARRPRIGVTWTLKANNVEELPAFIERAIGIGIEQVTLRHLLVFHGHSRGESVVDRPEIANGPLRATYELLRRHGIRGDCPPLIEETAPVGAHRDEGATPVVLRRTPGNPQRDGCMFVHRTAVVHVDGLVPTCAAPFAAAAGRFGSDTTFGDIWNGEVLREVRSTIDTPAEWPQCTNCWYREGRYQSQRRSYDSGAQRYDISAPDELTRRSWDFEQYRQD